jgi:NAD(P)-dependent dehydrogenase (short-subunit alcohol dehydrogenase family)
MRELKGRNAVVTGAASGIGLAMVEMLLKEGMRVTMADIEKTRLDKEAQRLAARGEVHAVVTDVSKLESIQALQASAEKAFGPTHALFNNAGVEAPAEYALETPMRHWEWIVTVNMWGVVYGCMTFLPGMNERNVGHVVNTSSIGGLMAVPFHVPYSMVKHGIVGLSMGLQTEQKMRGSEVGVSVLCPTFTATSLLESTRNFPKHLGDPSMGKLTEAGKKVDDWERSVVTTTTPPSEMARLAIDAMKAGKFWAVPDWPLVMGSGGTLQDHIKDLWASSMDGRDLPIMDPRKTVKT